MAVGRGHTVDINVNTRPAEQRIEQLRRKVKAEAEKIDKTRADVEVELDLNKLPKQAAEVEAVKKKLEKGISFDVEAESKKAGRNLRRWQRELGKNDALLKRHNRLTKDYVDFNNDLTKAFERQEAGIKTRNKKISHEVAVLNEKLAVLKDITRATEEGDKMQMEEHENDLRKWAAEKKRLDADKAALAEDRHYYEKFTAAEQKAILKEQEQNLKDRDRLVRQKIKGYEEDSKNLRVLDNDLKRLVVTSDKVVESTTDRSRAIDKEGVRVAKLHAAYAKWREEEDRLMRKRKSWFGREKEDDSNLKVVRAEINRVRNEAKRMNEELTEPPFTDDVNRRKLDKFAKSLERVRVQLGLFSLSLRAMLTVGAFGGNVLSSLVAAASTLIGTLGAGLLGAAGLASAGVAGLGLAAAGTAMVIVPLVKELGDARKAMKAYDKAVKEHGKGSSQAKSAEKKLDNVLGNTSEEVKEGLRGIQDIQKEWAKVTESAKPDVFRTFAEGVKTARELLPTFGRETVKTISAAARATDGLLKALRGDRAKSALGELMQNTRMGLPALIDGFGKLLAVVGLITVSFSRHLPAAFASFNEWTGGMLNAVSNTRKLDEQVDGLMDHFSSLADFLKATGSLIWDFFASGADQGRDFLDDMTAKLQEWNDWINSFEGQQTLQKWFEDGIKMTKDLGSALGNLMLVLADVGAATRPIVGMFINVADAMFKMIDAAMDFGPAAAIIKTFIGAFAGYKIMSGVSVLITAMGTAALGAAGSFGLALTSSRLFFRNVGRGNLSGGIGKLSGLTGLVKNFVGVLPGIGVAAALAFPIVSALVKSTKADQDALNASIQRTKTLLDSLKDDVDAEITAGAAVDANKEQIRTTKERLRLAEEEGASQTEIKALKSEIVRLQREQVNLENEHTEAIQKRQTKTGEALAAADDIRKEAKAILDARNVVLNPSSGRNFDLPRIFFGKGIDPVKISDPVVEAMNTITDSIKNTGNISDETKAQVRGMLDSLSPEDKVAFWDAARKAADDYKKSMKDANKATANALIEAATTNRALQDPKLKPLNMNKVLGPTARALDRGIPGEKIVEILLTAPNEKAVRRRLNKLVDEKRTAEIDVDADTSEAKRQIRVVTLGNYGTTVYVGADASAAMASINTLIASIPKAFDFKLNNVGYAGGPAFYSGTSAAAMVGRASASASKRMALTGGRSREVRKPTYITGEESGHNEYVIATNPAYRKANLRYLQMAAADLGADVVPGFASGGLAKYKRAAKKANKRKGGSKYEQLHRDWDYYNNLYSAHQRSFTEGLTDGPSGGISTMAHLKSTKQKVITTIEKLLGHIKDPMMKVLKKAAGTKVPGPGKKPVFGKKKPRRSDFPAGSDGSRAYTEANDSYARQKETHDRKMDAWENRARLAKEGKGNKRDAKSEWKRLEDERRNLLFVDLPQAKMDMVELLEGRVTAGTGGGGSGGSGAGRGFQEGSLNVARMELMRGFGSNYSALASSIATPSFATPTAFAAAMPKGFVGGHPGMPDSGPYHGGGPGAAPNGGKTVIINNTFANVPADPLTWSKQVGWEMNTVG